MARKEQGAVERESRKTGLKQQRPTSVQTSESDDLSGEGPVSTTDTSEDLLDVVPRSGKDRLDKVLVYQGICTSRQQARGYILAGQVLVADRCIDKVGTVIPVHAPIRLRGERMPYVSRGGLKLEAILEHCTLDVTDRVVLDLGTSTGGFCDCLLQRGCRKVIGVDVGYGQLHPSLRSDPRVISLERTNARYLTPEQLPLLPGESISLITADLSFISLRLVLPAVVPCLVPGGDMLLLVKPQFEVGREHIQKGGVVHDDQLRQKAADDVAVLAMTLGLVERMRMDSPIHGPKGNIEILLWLHFPRSEKDR